MGSASANRAKPAPGGSSAAALPTGVFGLVPCYLLFRILLFL
ncbi:hypothetical protein ACE4RR_11500 [Alteribacillus sp. HJP-4]